MQKRQLTDITKYPDRILREVKETGEDILVEDGNEEIAVVVPMDRYRSTMDASRRAIMHFANEARRRMGRVPPEQLAADIAEAIREVRAEGRRSPRAKK